METGRHYLAAACLMLCLGLAALVAGGGLGLYFWVSRDLPGFNKITDYRPSLVTTVYTRDGHILGYLYREKRFLVRLSEVPFHTREAFLAVEDSTFYQHQGFDLTAMIRAFFKNLKAGSIVQGASTINQQIIKQILLTPQRKYERKLKEAILAYRLDNRLTKDEILTIYLNQIYFGSGAYGVEAAARTFFGKHTGELTLAESALLAGLPKAPSGFNPFHYPEAAKKRQRHVLRLMRQLGWISTEEYGQALEEPLVYKSIPEPSWTYGPYYLEEVRRFLIEYLSRENMNKLGIKLDRYGEDAVYESGLHVVTGMDPVHQEAAEIALRRGLIDSSKRRGWRGPVRNLAPEDYEVFLDVQKRAGLDVDGDDLFQALVVGKKKGRIQVRVGDRRGYIEPSSMGWIGPRRELQVGDVVYASAVRKTGEKWRLPPGNNTLALALEQKPEVQGGLVSIEPPTGDVLALVGGFDFTESQYCRATQARRQPGSAFKPIVYSAAMDCGYTPYSVVYDSPIWLGGWSPKNYGGGYYGPTTLAYALIKSRNVVTVRLAHSIGVSKVIERAKALGLEPDFPRYLPICLGAEGVTLINLCQAYTAFARDGTYVKPRLVLSIKSAWNEEIRTLKPESVRAVSHKNAHTIASILQDVVQRGTGVRARALGRPVAGKTGTTNDEKDAWFIGFAPYLLSGVYVGFDKLTPMGRGETGSRAALPIWLGYRKAVEQGYPVEDFALPPEGPAYRSIARTSPKPRKSGNELKIKLSREEKKRAPSAPVTKKDSAVTREELLKRIF